MNRNTKIEYHAETVSHPGETVLDYLESNNWSQRDLARRTGITPKTISEICNAKAPVTAQSAILFERVLGRPAHFWLNLQRQFDEAKVRVQIEAKSKHWNKWTKKFPLAEMKKYGWLEADKNKDSDINTLLNFFGVSSPKSWNSVWEATNVAYRQTRQFKTSNEAISAWIRATEIMADDLETEIEVRDFNEQSLKSCIDQLRLQTRKKPEDFTENIKSLCASAGVIVVWVPELKQTGISGCARWLSDKKALIALTLRYKSDDQMWFTFFHELGHVLLHQKEKNFILDNAVDTLGDQDIDPPMRAREEEANRFAADTLIPPESLLKFIRVNDFSNEAIHDFAEQIGIGPGIVVGRLQREGLLKYHEGNALKQIFDWNTEE